MRSFRYTITDPVGIHARPAGALVTAAKALSSEIVVEKGGKSSSAKRLMALMTLGVQQGDTVTVTITGENEAQDAAAMEKYFKENL